jgi:uncharacterized protein
MNVFRILLILAAIWIVWRLLRGLRIHISRAQSPPQPPGENFEPMARCAQCGVHLPASALSPDGRCGKCTGNG